MSHEFIRITSTTDIPADKDAQIRIILEGRVQDAVYRKFMSAAPLAKVTDYSSFFQVTLEDLRHYIRTHSEEVNRLLPWESDRPRSGIGIVRTPIGFELREHDDHGVITGREEFTDLAAVYEKWLQRLLLNQGLRSLLDR